MHTTTILALITDAAWLGGCLLAVDFIAGLLHWAEDTWLAPGHSKMLDRWVVTDNIEHHRKPGLIRAGHYWETNRVCVALASIAGCILVAAHAHAWQAYTIVLLASQSNQVHLWAHSSTPPRIVGWLQSLGILQSRRHHGIHHSAPYATKYCTMTNYLNPILDGIGFWRTLEGIFVFFGATVQRATPARAGY